MAVTYRDAGVDPDAADALVDRFVPHARRTHRPEVLAGLGGFAARIRVPLERFREPLMVSGSDGVGTKLRIALATGRVDTIGIDLVAMCANDVATCGAEPLFFLDTISAGRLDPALAERLVAGIAEGCVRAGCALVGGETAELPGHLRDGDWDLTGTCVGLVEASAVIDGSAVKTGDRVLGVASNGLHANGFSLVRRIFGDAPDGLVDELLRPTHVYAKLAVALARSPDVHAMAHVTGGGLPGNLPRVLPPGTRARLDTRRWPIPLIFQQIRDRGPVAPDELARTFNLGLGWCVVVAPDAVQATLEVVHAHGFEAFDVGAIEPGPTTPDTILEHLA